MRRAVGGALSVLTTAIAFALAGCVPGATFEPSIAPGGIATASPSSATVASPSPIEPLPDLPAGLPVMPGAQPAQPPLDPGTIAQWTVPAIGPDVYDFYLDALPAAGFAITDRFPGGSVAIIRFTTPGGSTLDLSLVGEGDYDRTRVELHLPEGP